MFLGFRVSCTCNCTYSISEKISVDKIVCPNCGLPHPYSDKLIDILKIADEIPGACSVKDVFTEVISPHR